MKWIIVTGNPVDGFEFTGPYDTQSDASDAANNDGVVDDVDYWIAKLNTPEEV